MGLELLVDAIYVYWTQNMDKKQKEEFDDALTQPIDPASDVAREQRRQFVARMSRGGG